MRTSGQPARHAVLRELRSMIHRGDVARGDPLPSERELAMKFQVDRKTVRRAIVELVREGLVNAQGARRPKIVQRARPASHPILGKSVAVFSEFPLSTSGGRTSAGWDLHIQLRALEQLQQHGYNVVSIHPAQVEQIQPADIIGMQFAGVVMLYGLAASAKGQSLLRACRDAGIPAVAYGDDPALEMHDRVSSDHERGAADLVHWLHARGCRRIQRFWRMSTNPRWLAQRDAGYERACRELGIEPLPAIRTPDLAAFFWSSGQSADDYNDLVRVLLGFLYRAIMDPPGVDAIMVATDPHAYQVASVLKLLGKVPNRDVQIVGYDNSWQDIIERQWEPHGPAATVDKNNDRVAGSMIELLQQRIAGELPPAPQIRMLDPQLIVCAPDARS